MKRLMLIIALCLVLTGCDCKSRARKDCDSINGQNCDAYVELACAE